MPQTVNIKGVGTVHFPDDFTPEQIQQAIETDILPQAKPQAAPEPAFTPEKPTLWERFGRGAQNTVDRLAQLTATTGEKLGYYQPGYSDVLTEMINQERADYDRFRGSQGFDIMETLGATGTQAPLIALPGGKETKLAKAGWGAVSGGLSGLLQYDETNSLEGTAKNVGVGASAGAVANPLTQWAGGKFGKLVETAYGRVRGVLARFGGDASEEAIERAVPELAELPPQARADLIREAKAQITRTGELSADQISRKANLLANEVQPTKSMVTRDPSDWALERNLQKLGQSPDPELSNIGRELTDVYQQNDQALSRSLTRIGEGIPRATQEAYGETVMRSIDDLAEASQKEVGKLYTAIKEAKGADLAFDGRNLKDTLDGLQDNAYAEKLVTSVTNKLRRFGMIDKDGNLTSNTLTVSQAEELRKFVNSLPNDFGRRDIIKAIDADVIEGAGEDAFKAARDAAGKRFAMLENPATQRALNAYGELTQGKTAQNFIKSQVIDGSARDVKALVQTIEKIPDEAKRAEALNAMRGGVLSYLEAKAINPNSGQFSGANLNKAIQQIGDEKLTTVLGFRDFNRVKSLARASLDATYQPPYSAVNHANTAPMLMGLMQKARSVPGVPLIVTDEAQNMAARSGYGNQLATALGARSSGRLPEIPTRAREIGKVLLKLGVPAGAVAGNQSLDAVSKKPDDKRKDR